MRLANIKKAPNKQRQRTSKAALSSFCVIPEKIMTQPQGNNGTLVDVALTFEHINLQRNT